MLGRGRWYNCPNLVSATLEGDEGGHEGGDRSGYCGDRCRNRGCHHVKRAAPLHLGVRCEVVERSGLLAHLLRKLRKRHVRGLFCHCQPSVSQRLSSSWAAIIIDGEVPDPLKNRRLADLDTAKGEGHVRAHSLGELF